MKFAGVIYSSTPSYLSLVVILAGALGAATVYTQAQSGPSPGAYNVTARTMDSRTWTSSVTTTDPVSGVVWTHSGMEERLVIKKAPPPPSAYGMSDFSRLQYWAAMNCPAPVEQRPVLLNSGLVDHILIFDGYWMPVGGVFAIGQAPVPPAGQAAQIHLVDPSDEASVPLAKSLVKIGSQTVLVEEITFADLTAQLKKLGLAAAPRIGSKVVEFASRAELLPRRAEAAGDRKPIQIVSAPYALQGLVLDPYVTLSGSASSYSFGSGTYYIPTSYYVGPGGVTFWNGAVLKFGQNANLLVYGTVNFPGYGDKVVFTSKDDNGYGLVIDGSTSAPGYAAQQELLMYYPTNPGVIQTATFRWAQRGIDYEENPGVQNNPSTLSCTFQNCSIGLYQNTPSDSLHLTNDTYCSVVTPRYAASGGVTGSISNDCGTATTNLLVDASRISGGEGEPTIAINPNDPQNLFMAANYYSDAPPQVGWARSTNGGATWSAFSLFTNSYEDPSSAFDAFGNLFVCYAAPDFSVVVLLSTNKGSAFVTNMVFSGHYDHPGLTTGPGGAQAPSSVWVTFYDVAKTNSIVAGAPVTNLGVLGGWSTNVITNTGSDPGVSYGYGFGDIAVGPTGQVAVVLQDGGAGAGGPTTNRISVNVYGLNRLTSFTSASNVATSSVGFHQDIPAQPEAQGITATPGLAWDRTGGQYRGRLYMVYTDRTNVNNLSDTDIYVIHSDDNGTNWTGRLKINTDSTTTSQFFPRIAVDQTSGKVAVSWYDCRGDTVTNEAARFYAAVSSDGGATFSAGNLQLETGQSDAPFINSVTSGCTNNVGSSNDYSDYTGLAYYGGYLYAAWADNSNTTTNNPNNNCGMDIYVAKVRY
jgi:hypothetical protein